MLLLIPVCLFGSEIDPNYVRNQFVQATQRPDFREALADELRGSLQVEEAFTKAYLGATMTLVAQNNRTPWAKYNDFTDGIELLEEAINQSPSTAEYRYLRLMIQLKAPSFLAYDDQIRNDYLAVKKAIRTTPSGELWMDHFKAFESNHSLLIRDRVGTTQ